MTQPLALLCYERLLPGSQLANRLRDLDYRVQMADSINRLVVQAEEEHPLVVLIDLATRDAEICAVIRELRANPTTNHIPVLAFSGQENRQIQDSARLAGATLIADDQAILQQLPQLLNKVLEVD